MTGVSVREGPTRRILLVEDDDVFRRTLELILTEAGFDVLAASGYLPALRHLDGGERIDVLVSDIVMPSGVNGLALSRMARMRRPDLGIVNMTAYDIPGAADESVGNILRKPFDKDQLLDAIRHALDSRNSWPNAAANIR